MLTLSLDGEWELFYFPSGELRIDGPDELEPSDLSPIPAQVPGNVELDLQRAGRLPDPFYAANIRLLRPLETYEWWYRRHLVVPEDFAAQPYELVFDGLDTFATIWVNGVKVGQSANMLVEQRFDVSAVMQCGRENTFVVRLAPAMLEARRHTYDSASVSWEHRFEGLFIRKAAHMWGWDILPRAVSAGIWRSVRLETVAPDAIEQLYYWTVEADPHQAILGARFQVRTAGALAEGLVLRFHGACRESEFSYEWPLEFIADGCTLPIENPRLWWPAGYGEPNLYTLTARLCQGEKVLAERTDRVGLRTLKVDRTELAGQAWMPQPAATVPSRVDLPPDPGSHFVIYVNGQPIQVKGTNWVPLDAFHSRDAGRLEAALAMVKDLNCTMLRCWGGNVYEADAFFDWCDANGVMVWQDFAYAGCVYPQTEEFLEQVRAEAEKVVRRLRNHPCLALWCGDNEIDMTYLSFGMDPQHNRLTRETLPRVLQRLDPFRAFIPSSPYAPPAVVSHPDAWTITPEQHLWGRRGYYKTPFYARHSAHFIGEIGYHGCPDAASIQKFISPEHVWPWQENDEWQVHAVYHWNHSAIERDRIQLMANQVKELFGEVPDTLERFVIASQITQAEAEKFFIESTRLRKFQTSGILWWNLLDGWPQFSDAVVDYYFAKKLAYQYIWRVQRPVCLICGELADGELSGGEPAGGYLPIVACNDSLVQQEGHYRIWDAARGETAVEGGFSLPPNQNWQVERIPVQAGEQRLFLIEWEIGGQRYGNHYLYGPRPFSLDRYLVWLRQIAILPRAF